jgi:endonuclease YncB( thermonuclease family)
MNLGPNPATNTEVFLKWSRLFILITILLYSTLVLAAPVLTGKVIHVSDGDTFKILVNHKQIKVRLAEIDAPELHQAFGRKSKQYLGNLVFDKVVTVEQVDIDRYGRTVGKVYLDKLYVNAEMVRTGNAWFYRKYGKDLKLYDLENAARANRRGLWADPNPMPPWEWRKKN